MTFLSVEKKKYVGKGQMEAVELGAPMGINGKRSPGSTSEDPRGFTPPRLDSGLQGTAHQRTEADQVGEMKE